MTEAKFWRYVRRAGLGLLGLFLAWKLQQTLQLVAIALFLAGAISPLVREMQRWKISRSWAVGIIYFGLLLLLGLTLAPAPPSGGRDGGNFWSNYRICCGKFRCRIATFSD
ncbi:MAG: hypothetical protein HC918_01580 [Oscillatoriales cyanobacterium SM2_1_8]|nr:hypothetical protein [Oscillatoriales cyanobacterium SM2_1_8]